MPLIDCPECGKQISDKSVACPHCGLPSRYYGVAASAIHPVHSPTPANGPTAVSPSTVAQDDKQEDFNPQDLRNALISFPRDHAALFSRQRYIDTYSAQAFRSQYARYYVPLDNDLVHQYILTNAATLQIDDNELKQFISAMRHLIRDVDAHNRAYVARRVSELKGYFDHLMDSIDPSIKLDPEQRRAVVTDDNYCLVVAGAGAGKTTTMAAKVKYLVEKENVLPEDVIVISYTNKAIGELRQRINKQLKIPAKVATFHAFAYDVIRKHTDRTPEVNFSAYNIIFDMLSKSIFNDRQLMRNLVLFMGYYFDLPDDVFQFKTLNDYHQYRSALEYETLRSGLGEYVQDVARRRVKKARTITGEFLRSIQEVQIANFLYLNGIDYVYERPYPQQLPKAKKQYTPDFYISQGDNEAYIEHFGVSDRMQSSAFSAQQMTKYQKGIGDKRRLHRSNGTNLIETWSDYSDGGSLLAHLEESLVASGFVIKSRNLDEVYKKIVETGRDKYVSRLVWFTMRFVEQFKTSGYDEAGFKFLKEKTDNVRTLLYLDIAEKVFLHYQRTLKNSNQIDFADMINDANHLLAEMERASGNPSYKYIIIDEFQDIARQRFNLAKRLSSVTNAKVVAVGDDWQSVFAFAGADITLFTRFLELMGSGTEMKISHTYRNSQELIDIAGDFVQKNSSQIKKRLISAKHIQDPIHIEFYDDRTNTFKNLAKATNECIKRAVTEFGADQSILLIGRYNFDLYKLVRTGEFRELADGQVRSKSHPNARLTFMTAHSSKGLGYDNVILLNMLEGRFGFPSQIEDDPIIKMVTYEDKSIPFAEERRLFYVALTRTKNRVYIAAPQYRPSRFLLELITEYKLPHPTGMNLKAPEPYGIRCPLCEFPLRYELNKNYGLNLYMCTNEAEICDFMTNDRTYLKDIFKCPQCDDGFLIVKKNRNAETAFYGCTNYSSDVRGCKNTISISSE